MAQLLLTNPFHPHLPIAHEIQVTANYIYHPEYADAGLCTWGLPKLFSPI